jgi:hypothetical protein
VIRGDAGRQPLTSRSACSPCPRIHLCYTAVSPQDGALDWMLTAKMDTLNMNAFLDHVSQRHADDYIVMVLDGASSHRSHDLCIPGNMALVRFPPYSTELNPAERLREEILEKEFANRVFDSLGAAIA